MEPYIFSSTTYDIDIETFETEYDTDFIDMDTLNEGFQPLNFDHFN